MGVRPPDDGGEEPESIEFGIAALDAHLRRTDLSFPASKGEVDDALGSKTVPYDVYGNTVTLATVLEETDRERFETRQELMNDLHPVFEEYRARHSGGFLAQVRSLLPF